MLFSSITFLFWFLPAAIILYAIAPKKLKNAVLVIVSLVFYAWGEPKYVFLMLGTVAAGYVFGLLIEHIKNKDRSSKAVFILSVSFVLASLLFFKYSNFFVETINNIGGLNLTLPGIALPIGISFYTFQLLSYLADVYRGEEKAQRNFIDLAAYISFFPQLIAGPIVRYGDIAAQLRNRKHTADKIYSGIKRFTVGLSKKVLIANILAEFCNIFYASEDKSILFCWAYGLAFAMQIYFDFSGYSDMAIGLGSVFGFDFPENFNYPFISSSVTEFWRRWHMTLGTWFRDYVYIPLGGNRVSVVKHLRNILVVWALTGLWHGASWTFVCWGLFYAIWLTAEKFFLNKLLKNVKVIRHILLILITITGFIIFDSPNMSSAFSTIGNLFGAGGYPLISVEFMYFIKSYAIVFALGLLGSTPLPKNIYNKLKDNNIGKHVLMFAEPAFVIILLALCTAFLVDGSFNPFLYFRF